MRKTTESHKKEEREKAEKRLFRHHQNRVVEGQDPASNDIQQEAVNGHAARMRPDPKPRCDHGKDDSLRIIHTATELMSEEYQHQMKHHKGSKFAKTNIAKQLFPEPLQPITKLGSVLYRAALLHEAMDYYQEQELIKSYLHHEPPFHPRRTLDQSYYWTLKTTKKRDRDQVVYRGTAPKKKDKHEGVHVSSGCVGCVADIRKVPRVVMVDQLWLWILNGSKLHLLCYSVHRSESDNLSSCRYNYYQFSKTIW